MLYFSGTREGRAALAMSTNIARWLDEMKQRPRVKDICIQIDWVPVD